MVEQVPTTTTGSGDDSVSNAHSTLTYWLIHSLTGHSLYSPQNTTVDI